MPWHTSRAYVTTLLACEPSCSQSRAVSGLLPRSAVLAHGQRFGREQRFTERNNNLGCLITSASSPSRQSVSADSLWGEHRCSTCHCQRSQAWEHAGCSAGALVTLGWIDNTIQA